MSEQQPTQRPALQRSSTDKVIAGVCGGLARTLGIDPVVVRVIVAVLAIFGGAGFAAYVIAWILIPSDDGSNALRDARVDRSRMKQFLLVFVLAIAGISLVDSLPGRWDGAGFLALLVIGFIAWQAFGSDWFSRTSVQHTPDAQSAGFAVEKSQDGESVTVHTPAGRTVIKQERKSPLQRVVWNVIVLSLGAMIALNWADATTISARTMIIVCLTIAALGLLVSAFVGRARGLIVLGIVLVGLLALPQGVDMNQGTGNRTWIPATAIEATTADYDLGIGDATLDLRKLVAGMQPADTAYIHAHVGLGNLKVLLPYESTARFTLNASSSVGDITLPDQPKSSGVDHTLQTVIGTGAGPSITLDLNTSVGNLEVRYA